MTRVLVVEDDAVTNSEIVSELEKLHFEVVHTQDGREGLELAATGAFDLITLDRLLPSLDGLSIVEAIRRAGWETPVLMISALGDVDERIRGLRAGGDDYITKPFSPAEMATRAQVLLRRRAPSGGQATHLRVHDVEIELISRRVWRSGREIELQPMEYKLLEFLMRNPGVTLSRRIIFEQVWEYYFDPGANLINVHIGRLRRKLEPPGSAPVITTVWGSGYRFGPPL